VSHGGRRAGAGSGESGQRAGRHDASDVADDILTHLVPGAVVVPAMVAAIAVLQHEYGYAYTTLAL